MEFTTGAAVLAYVLGAGPAGAASADQVDRAGKVAGAINAAMTKALDWSADRVATVLELAELEPLAAVASADLWKRRDAPFGVTGFADGTGQSVRVARDPIESIRPSIVRYRDGAAGNFG